MTANLTEALAAHGLGIVPTGDATDDDTSDERPTHLVAVPDDYVPGAVGSLEVSPDTSESSEPTTHDSTSNDTGATRQGSARPYLPEGVEVPRFEPRLGPWVTPWLLIICLVLVTFEMLAETFMGWQLTLASPEILIVGVLALLVVGAVAFGAEISHRHRQYQRQLEDHINLNPDDIGTPKSSGLDPYEDH